MRNIKSDGMHIFNSMEMQALVKSWEKFRRISKDFKKLLPPSFRSFYFLLDFSTADRNALEKDRLDLSLGFRCLGNLVSSRPSFFNIFFLPPARSRFQAEITKENGSPFTKGDCLRKRNEQTGDLRFAGTLNDHE